MTTSLQFSQYILGVRAENSTSSETQSQTTMICHPSSNSSKQDKGPAFKILAFKFSQTDNKI